MSPELPDEELELLDVEDEDDDEELDELLEDELEEELEELPELDEPAPPPDEVLLEVEPVEAGFPELPVSFSVISVLQPHTTAKKIAIMTSLILRMMPPLISTAGIKQIVFLSRKRR